MLRRTRYLIVLALTAVATAAVTALLVNISERKQEARQHYVKLVDLHEAIVDPAVWGQNFPREYDGYRRSVLQAR
jgi:nitrite reductase (cytochrome c-552)